MEYKYIKINLNKFKIKYKGVEFRDINEYITDLKNIFIQMVNIYEEFKQKRHPIKDKTELNTLNILMNEQLKNLQEKLHDKLDYITDSNKVSETLINKARSKLIQLKSLNESIDIIKNPEQNINRLTDFYYKRVL